VGNRQFSIPVRHKETLPAVAQDMREFIPPQFHFILSVLPGPQDVARIALEAVLRAKFKIIVLFLLVGVKLQFVDYRMVGGNLAVLFIFGGVAIFADAENRCLSFAASRK